MQIILTLDRFENEKAVLKTDNGESVIWPKDKLPENLADGSVLSFDILEERAREEKAKRTAKDIINEIIGQAE